MGHFGIAPPGGSTVYSNQRRGTRVSSRAQMPADISPLSPSVSAAIRALSIDATAGAVVDDLRSSGIRPLLLKGPSFARWLYADPVERRYGDIDLIVSPDQFERTERRLAAAGFTHMLDGAAASELVSTRGWYGHGVVVELHRSFHQVGASDDAAWRELSAATERIPLGSTWVEVPGLAARCMLVALHAVAHGREVEQPLRDLERAIERAGEADWAAAAAMARRLDAAAAMAIGLRLVRTGAPLADRLGLSPARASTDAILRASTPPRTSVSIDRLARTPGALPKLRFLARRIFPTPAGMRWRYGIATGDRRRLAAAYALRPLSLLRDVGPGALAWWRARRAVAGTRGRWRARLDPATLRAAWWAQDAARLARRQVAAGGLESLALPPAPRLPPRAERGVRAVLRRRGERCLVSAAVRQAWHRGQGDERDLIVGVTAPTPEFGAHAWLAGDPVTEDFEEIGRRPAVAR